MRGELIPGVALIIFLFLLPAQAIRAEEESSPKDYSVLETQLQEKPALARMKEAIIHDYTRFYAQDNLLKLSLGIGVAALFANTEADQNINDWYQDEVRNEGLDEFSQSIKLFGEGKIIVPTFLGAAILGELTENTSAGSTIGRWGKKSLRSILVGIPPLLLLQKTLGASRPDEFEELGEEKNRKRHNSYYRFFKDDNGISGHAFMGAIPFITAAKMTDKLYIKLPLYGLSTLPVLSRINDEAHYFSQAALGWWLAYLSTDSVFKQDKEKPLIISPLVINPSNNSPLYGLSLVLMW